MKVIYPHALTESHAACWPRSSWQGAHPPCDGAVAASRCCHRTAATDLPVRCAFCAFLVQLPIIYSHYTEPLGSPVPLSAPRAKCPDRPRPLAAWPCKSSGELLSPDERAATPPAAPAKCPLQGSASRLTAPPTAAVLPDPSPSLGILHPQPGSHPTIASSSMTCGMLPRQLATALLAALAVLTCCGVAAAPLRNPDGSCMMFPPGSPWRQDISGWPVYSRSRWVAALGHLQQIEVQVQWSRQPAASLTQPSAEPRSSSHCCCLSICMPAATSFPPSAPTRASMPTFRAARSEAAASSISERWLGSCAGHTFVTCCLI